MSVTSPSYSNDKSSDSCYKIDEEEDESNYFRDLTTTSESSFTRKSCSFDGSCLETVSHRSSGQPNDTVMGDCAGCGQVIRDQYFLFALNKNWHVSCLKCHSCHVPLDSQVSCFTHEGKIFCRQDFFR